MSAERLMDIARRLDELAEGDHANEITAISEELGYLAEKWPQREDISPITKEIERLVMRAAEEKVRDPMYRRDDRSWVVQEYARTAMMRSLPDPSKMFQVTP